MRINFPPAVAFLLFILFIFGAACGDGGDDDDTGGQSPDDSISDDDNDDDTGVDAVSSATPGRNSNLLTENHSGWKNPACSSCHAEKHLGGFAQGECVTCHGSNGAPRRAAGHATANCASCHPNTHASLGYAEQHCTACHKFEAGDICPATEEYDAVVIGAGGGGLAAALSLANAGLSVALVEKHYKVGGYMTTFRRGDYTFEASLHAMNGLDENGTTAKIFQDLGILDRLQPHKADPMYYSFFPGSDRIPVPADIGAYLQSLKDRYPAEAENLDRFFADLEELNITLDAVMRLKSDFNLNDLLTVISHLRAGLKLLECMNITLAEFVAQYIQDPQLTGLWEQLVTFVAGGPSDLQAVFFISMWNSYHREGYYYLTGGSRAVSEAMADVFRERGGVVKLNTLATKIVITEGLATQVQTQDDLCLNTRYVVSNANATDTLLKMIGADHLPADYVTALNGMTVGLGTLQVFLGVTHDYTGLFPGTHEIMINETWSHDESFDFIAAGDLNKVPYLIADYTAIDATTAPEGKNAISVTTFLPYDWQDRWHWDQTYDDYVDVKTQAAQVLIQRAEAFLPGLSQYIEVMEVGSPMTNFAYALAPGGSIIGWENTPDQATLHRLPQQTPIDNVLLAGAWTFPGGGQSAVISSGISAADVILKNEGLK
jgi:phytoene dehydrogenase-like protein